MKGFILEENSSFSKERLIFVTMEFVINWVARIRFPNYIGKYSVEILKRPKWVLINIIDENDYKRKGKRLLNNVAQTKVKMYALVT